MDSFFKMIDRIFQAVPPDMQKMVRLGVLGLWGVLVVFVIVWSFRAGSDSVPQSGEDMYLANIKEKVYRDRMKRDPADVTLPDLNELSKEEAAPMAVYQPEPANPRGEQGSADIAPLPLQGEADQVIFPEKGVRPSVRNEPTEKPSRQPDLMPLDR